MTETTKSNDNDTWDIKITSGSSYLDFRINELWHYRDLLMMFVKKKQN